MYSSRKLVCWGNGSDNVVRASRALVFPVRRCRGYCIYIATSLRSMPEPRRKLELEVPCARGKRRRTWISPRSTIDSRQMTRLPARVRWQPFSRAFRWHAHENGTGTGKRSYHSDGWFSTGRGNLPSAVVAIARSLVDEREHKEAVEARGDRPPAIAADDLDRKDHVVEDSWS